MPISVLRPKIKGYSILELILVLALGSAIIATVAPNLTKTFQSFTISRELREISSQVNLFSKRAFLSGKTISVNQLELELPLGWEVETEKPINFSAKGFCNGGRLVLKKNGSEMLKAELKPPFCELRLYEN